MIRIPFFGENAAFSQQVDLDGGSYTLSFAWNTRDEAWYMDVSALDETRLADGIKLVLGAELLRSTRRPGIPPGELYVVPSNPLTRLARDSFAGDASLIYMTEAEANA